MDRLREEWEKFLASLSEQEWYQELQEKWDELDPQSKLYIRIGGVLSGIVGSLVVIFMVISAVTETKRSYEEKAELLDFLQAAGDEMKALKATTGRTAPAGGKPNWRQHFMTVAGTSGMGAENVAVENMKTGKKTDLAEEVMFDLKLQKIGVRQLVRYAFYLEHGVHPIKLRHMRIVTQDAEGYLEAILAVSAFELKPEE